VLRRVDVQAVLDRIDLQALIERRPPRCSPRSTSTSWGALDLDALIQRIDVNATVDRVDINAVVDRVDIEDLVARTEIGRVIMQSTTSIATWTLDAARSTGVGP
jgi:hypothetical protein